VAPAAGAKTAAKAPDFVPGELIVKLRDAAGPRAQAAVFSALQKALGPNAVLGANPFVTDGSLQKVRLARKADLQPAIAALNAEPAVLYAEPNFIYRALDADTGTGAPNDPEFAKLWGLKNTGQTDAAGQVGKPGADINVLPLWAEGVTGSRDVVVAVIDTGIDWTHPDIQANLYTNTAEIEGNGKDDDGNGFVDDVHGWNFNESGKNNNSRDDHDHGTHCAGTIGGVGNNGTGVAGVNWNVSLMPVKFLSAGGSGTLEGAVNSINYATQMKVNIMSNSWGGGGFSQALKDSIEKAKAAGILFVAAAGNESNNNDASPTYPAGYQVDNVVAVAATDNQDKIATFSNHGARTVHVAAPGVKVFSTTKGGNYSTFSGTSMATPHVSGIAALLLSANPDWTFAEIKDRLIKTSDPVRQLRRKVVAKGRVNSYNALKGIIPPTDDPDESLWRVVRKSVESPHPYKDNVDLKFEVKHAGAKFIRVIFEKVEVEQNYDKVIVLDGAGEAVDEVTGSVTEYTSEYVKGDTLTIRLKADESNVGFGFKVSKIQVIN
jgi:subtilisin family serine protease